MIDVLDSLLEVECVSESSSKSDNIWLMHVEDVGMLVLLVLGVLGVILGELEGEGTFGVAVVGGIMCGPLMADRHDSISSFDGTIMVL